jgi:KTSC domain-containing protein
MNEKKIQDIKDALREMMQLLVARGEPLTDDLKTAITRAMEHAANRITQLRQEEQGAETLPPIEEVEEEQSEVSNQGQPPQPPPTPPTGGPIPPLEPAPFESSNINAMRYDPDKQEAYIKFQGKFPAQNGPVYKYSGVPAYIFDVIQRGSVAPKTSGANQWHRWKEGVTPSHGASVNALLKAGGFQYQRLS